MAHAIIWIIVAMLLGFWTLLAWTADAVLTWPGWSSASLAAWPAWVAGLQPPGWLAPWMPTEWLEIARQILIEWEPVIRDSLQQIPDLSGWLTAIVWAAWIIGALGFLLMGIAASAIARLFRPRATQPAA